MYKLLKNVKVLLGISVIISLFLSIIASKKIFVCELGMYKQHDRNVWSDMVCSQEIALCKTNNICIYVYPKKKEELNSTIGFKVRILSEHLDYEEFISLSDLKNNQWNEVNIYNNDMRTLSEHATVNIESINMTEDNYIMLNLGEDLNTVHYDTYIMDENQGDDNISMKYNRFSYVSFAGMLLLVNVIIFGLLYRLSK